MLVEYIRNISLFRKLKDRQLNEIASRCKSAGFRRGEVVFYKTDLSTDLYIVISGKLKAVLTDEEGDEIVLASFEKGDFFGELSLLDGKGRSATIVAESDAELAILTQKVFLDVLNNDPQICIELMATLVERVRKADELIESLAFLEVGERLVKTLLDAASGQAPAGKGFLKAGRATHKELAARIGSSREAVSKCMKILALKGITKETDDHFLISENALQLLKERRPNLSVRPEARQ